MDSAFGGYQEGILNPGFMQGEAADADDQWHGREAACPPDGNSSADPPIEWMPLVYVVGLGLEYSL